MTTPLTVCLLLTEDRELAERLSRVLADLADLRTPPSPSLWNGGAEAAVLRMLDLRHPEANQALADLDPDSRSGLIALGVPRSDPFLASADAGVFAVEALDTPAARLRTLVRQALRLQQAHEELALLRQQLALCAATPSPPQPAADEPGLNLSPLYDLWRATRHVQDIQKLLDQLVEGVAAAARVARVLLFARLRDEPHYRMWSGLRCLDTAKTLAFVPHDPFVRWLERHAHLVCRARLNHVDDLRQRRQLTQILNDTGSELIVPLLGKRGLLGWMFLGHRATGLPFSPRDLNDVSQLGEQVATLLENALLVEELEIQKSLAQSLLETLPVGILAASDDGRVRWYNPAAAAILNVPAACVLNRPVEQAGSRVADLIRRTLQGGDAPPHDLWTDPSTRRTIRAGAHRIGNRASNLAAMLLLTDCTRERLLRERQDEVDRQTFWNDLAAAMSHEVRNPLVAISTFAQLLPDRYAEPDFRQRFFAVVIAEVERLNAIITQINTFAHPPRLTFLPTAPAELVALACERATHLCGAKQDIVQRDVSEPLSVLPADADALALGLGHVLANAYEAVRERPSPQIRLLLRETGSDGARALVLAVCDNGPGIAPAVRDKLFSPFSTTKPRGLGLGLPLARRAIVDHGGRIDIDTTEQGTTVTITLPFERSSRHDETPDS